VISLAKPTRGTALLEHRQRRAELVQHERREMQAAKKRDGNKCRVPYCEFASMKLPIDVAHMRHRGMGGNPKGDRTERRLLVTLCRRHHGLYDGAELEIEPMTAALMDGPLLFAQLSESGHMETFAVERSIGVSETRT
jgi:hypothetical protein